MEKDLSAKVLEWLNKHGYPFEMEVASIFHKNGFQVAQGVYFIDEDMNVPREIDIIAYKNFQIKNYSVSFSFLIECKATKSKPWLAFVSKGHRKYKNLQNCKGTKPTIDLITHLEETENYNPSIFTSRNKNYAYSVTLALRDGDAVDVFYKCLQTLSKSTDYFLDKFKSNKSLLYFYFPIIAIDCPLFEGELIENGELVLTEVDKTTYLARNPKTNNIESTIDILTKSSINKEVEYYSEVIEKFMEDNSNEIKAYFNETDEWIF